MILSPGRGGSSPAVRMRRSKGHGLGRWRCSGHDAGRLQGAGRQFHSFCAVRSSGVVLLRSEQVTRKPYKTVQGRTLQRECAGRKRHARGANGNGMVFPQHRASSCGFRKYPLAAMTPAIRWAKRRTVGHVAPHWVCGSSPSEVGASHRKPYKTVQGRTLQRGCAGRLTPEVMWEGLGTGCGNRFPGGGRRRGQLSRTVGGVSARVTDLPHAARGQATATGRRTVVGAVDTGAADLLVSHMVGQFLHGRHRDAAAVSGAPGLFASERVRRRSAGPYVGRHRTINPACRMAVLLLPHSMLSRRRPHKRTID